MKNEMSACKNQSLQGSVKAEVGSEHCNSDGHITDSEVQYSRIYFTYLVQKFEYTIPSIKGAEANLYT